MNSEASDSRNVTLSRRKGVRGGADTSFKKRELDAKGLLLTGG